MTSGQAQGRGYGDGVGLLEQEAKALACPLGALTFRCRFAFTAGEAASASEWARFPCFVGLGSP